MKIIVEAGSAEELHLLFKELFVSAGTETGRVPDGFQVVAHVHDETIVEPKPKPKPEPEPEPEPEPAPKPKRKRRAKAQIEADKLAEEGMTEEEAKRLWGVCAASNNIEVTDRTLRILDSLGVERPSELDEQGLLTFGREAKSLLEQYPS